MGKDYRGVSYEVGGTVQNADYFTQEIAQALQSESMARNGNAILTIRCRCGYLSLELSFGDGE
jgi:hypothetical protein